MITTHYETLREYANTLSNEKIIEHYRNNYGFNDKQIEELQGLTRAELVNMYVEGEAR